jgi:hypothetical protein
VAGHAYLTQDTSYAQTYALGGVYAGLKGGPSPGRLMSGRYGHLFEVDPRDMHGAVRPDEDMVGEMLEAKDTPGGREGVKHPWLLELAKQYLTPRQPRERARRVCG